MYSTYGKPINLRLNPIRPGMGGGGGGGNSARADFNLRELPCYISNTNKTLRLLLKLIGEQDSGKRFCQGYNATFSQILTFLIFFILISNFFKTNANSLSQSQEIVISS